MQKIWRPLESDSLLPDVQEQAPALQKKFIQLSDWFDALKRIRPHFNGGTGPFPKEILEQVESFLPELFADKNVKLIHGDFHHFNILSSERGWLVIDPKGVAGQAEYEAGPLLINPYDDVPEEQEAIRRTQRRIAILSERLGFDRQRLRVWAICFSVLSSFWDMQEDGSGGESARVWSEIFLKMKV